jgi:hypothetical protein
MNCLNEIRFCCDVQKTVFVPENTHQHNANRKRVRADTNDVRLAEREEYVLVKERSLNIEHRP